ncbi:MAG: nucleoid-associated protein, YbaB/EbfC family [Chloroflexi bacterium RBG_16_64_32]|nr:MAG: nucleoid-associated protein, YbaB/EbfC family [Chloroflexi bacterium RBG_16_64_32]
MNQNMMKQIQQLQGRIAKAQEALQETTIEASSGGGAVAVVMNAQPKLNSITIQPEVVDASDVEMLQDLILAAVNEALEQARASQMQQLAGVAGGLNIPGLTG